MAGIKIFQRAGTPTMLSISYRLMVAIISDDIKLGLKATYFPYLSGNRRLAVKGSEWCKGSNRMLRKR